MRKILMGLLLGVVALIGPMSAVQGAAKWETSLDAALARARREGKPVLLLHMFGKLDDAFC